MQIIGVTQVINKNPCFTEQDEKNLASFSMFAGITLGMRLASRWGPAFSQEVGGRGLGSAFFRNFSGYP